MVHRSLTRRRKYIFKSFFFNIDHRAITCRRVSGGSDVRDEVSVNSEVRNNNGMQPTYTTDSFDSRGHGPRGRGSIISREAYINRSMVTC